MAIAPPCFVPTNAPIGDPQAAFIPAINPLQSASIPDMMAAINQLINTVNLMNDNTPGSPTNDPLGGGIGGAGGANTKGDKKKKPEKKKSPGKPTDNPAKDPFLGNWKELKSARKTTKVRLTNPQDTKVFVDVERIDSFTMVKVIPAPPNQSVLSPTHPARTTDVFTWTR